MSENEILMEEIKNCMIGSSEMRGEVYKIGG
jgi:hypothetical protein